MTFLSTKSLPRRTILRGLGVTLALPFLDAMLPAFSPRAKAAQQPVHRFPDLLCAERDGHGALVTQRGGARLRASSHSGAAGALSESDARAVGPQGPTGTTSTQAPPDRF